MTDKNGITRRGLVTAGGAGLAVTAVGSLSGEKVESWDHEADVVVCGSGAAGATAAIYACKAGVEVLVLEKGSAWGGTTAKSGSHIWIPNNFELRRRGIDDERRAVLEYMVHYSYPHLFNPEDERLGLDENTYELIAAFYDNGHQMVDQMMDWGAFKFRRATIWSTGEATPDYYDHSPYNKVPRGRGLEPIYSDGRFAGGKGVASMMRQLLEELGCDIRMRHRATELITGESGEVLGLIAEDEQGRALKIRARRGVVFATGCYSHNQTYLRQYQMNPVMGTCAVPTNEGDFIRIAGSVGAQMANMSGAWRGQVMLEDAVRFKAVPAVVYWPAGDSMLLVDRYGKRCVNEKRAYNDRVRQLYNYDATEAEYPHLLTYMIFDQRTMDLRAGHYPIPPSAGASDSTLAADSLAELAEKLSQRLHALRAHTGGQSLAADFAEQLKDSVSRFSDMANNGKDLDFGRGDHAEDREWGAFTPPHSGTDWPLPSENNPTMFPLQRKGPYYAIILAPGLLGTNGGPKVNPQTQVLDYHDRPIQGLYAAGNCMAHPAANAYWAAGATIGSALTFGKIAGEQAAQRRTRT
jgi:3-oxosteroid 1-dehydrogenase